MWKYLHRLVCPCLFLILLFSAPALASPSADVPLDSWVYPALDKLAGLGMVDSALQGSRPYTRNEAARQVEEALQASSRCEPLPVAAELLQRLEAEFKTELEEISHPEARTKSRFVPLRSLEADYVFRQGERSSYPNTNARQFALNYNNQGIEYREHHNLQVVAEAEARLGGFFLLNWRPILQVGKDVVTFRTLTGKAAFGLGPVELSFGREPLWWGQGRHGSLILTDNARPLDMLRLTNPSPVRLPWVLEYLGPFHFDLFISRLEDDRVVPHPWFGGFRLNLKPLSWLELGASRTVIFGGKGRPGVDASDFLTILGGRNLSGGDDTSDSIAALDARVRLPFLWGAEVYGELGGEDEANHFFSRDSFLLGAYLPRIEPTGRLGLRFEFADLAYNGNGPVWYRHGIYKSGYTYEQQILGHHAGGTVGTSLPSCAGLQTPA